MRESTASDERARELILRFGWNSTVYQLLNPDMRHWFAPGGDGLIGFVEHLGVRVVAGAPVTAYARLREVARAFEAEGRRNRLATCYFAVEPRWFELVAHRGEVALVGAQPVWDAAAWVQTVAGHTSLRAQFNRARNKGITVETWPTNRLLVGQPGSAELGALCRRWSDAHGLPPLRFLTSVEVLAPTARPDSPLVQDRRLYVALREGRPVAYLVASPIPLRHGWLIESVVRDPDAPNGTTELLIDSAVRDLAEGGARRLTLGLVPLSRRHGQAAALHPTGPRWLRLAFAWAHAHGRRFYNFAGLESFKEKFRPSHWEKVYLVSSGPRIDLRTLCAVAAAFTGGRAVATLATGVWRTYGPRARLD